MHDPIIRLSTAREIVTDILKGLRKLAPLNGSVLDRRSHKLYHQICIFLYDQYKEGSMLDKAMQSKPNNKDSDCLLDLFEIEF